MPFCAFKYSTPKILKVEHFYYLKWPSSYVLFLSVRMLMISNFLMKQKNVSNSNLFYYILYFMDVSVADMKGVATKAPGVFLLVLSLNKFVICHD